MHPIKVRIVIQSYGENDKVVQTPGPTTELPPGKSTELEWQIPDLGGAAIAQVGI